jgi:iron complex outermembrane recepter protein
MCCLPYSAVNSEQLEYQMSAPVFGRAVARALCLSTSVTSVLCIVAAPGAYAQEEPTVLPPVPVEPAKPAKPAAKPRTTTGPKTAAQRRTRNQGGQANTQPGAAAQTSGGQSQDPTAYSASDASTGTKTNTPIMTTPVSVQVVPQQVLQDQQVISIDQAVKDVSGVVTGAGLANNNGQPYGSVFVRGFPSDTIFRDGTRLDSYGSDSNLFLQQFANVDRVEVLKGPAAILYGAVEPGGIVNIVTKQPQSTPAYSVQEQVGSFGLNRTTINATGPASQDGSLLYRLDTSYDSSGSQVDFVKNRNFFIAPVLLWNIDADNWVKAEFNYRSSEFGQNYGFLPTLNGALINTNPSVNYGGSSPANETTNFGALTWMHRFDNDWSIKQRAVFSSIDVNSAGSLPFAPGGGSFVFPPNVVPTPSGLGVLVGINNVVSTDQNFNVTTDLTGHFETFGIAHTLLLGNDYGRFKTDGIINQSCQLDGNCTVVDLFNPVSPGTPFNPFSPGAPLTPPTLFVSSSQLTQTVGAYAQDQLKLPAGFYLLGGVRWQYLDQQSEANIPAAGFTANGTTEAAKLTPRAGILWHPREWLSLYGSYTTSFGPAKPGEIEANGQNVPPSSGEQLEAGVKFAFFGGKLTASAAYFDLTKTNIPSVNPVNPMFVTVIGAARSAGFEFDAQGEISPGWKVIANYAHTDARVIDSGPQDATPVGSRLGAVPIDLAHLWTTYEFQSASLRGWKIGGGMTFAGETPYTPIGTNSYTGQMLPDHTVFDLMTAFQFEAEGKKWTLQVNATNIFNRVYLNEVQQTASVPFQQIPGPGGTYSWVNGVYGPLRTIVASVKVEW